MRGCIDVPAPIEVFGVLIDRFFVKRRFLSLRLYLSARMDDILVINVISYDCRRRQTAFHLDFSCRRYPRRRSADVFLSARVDDILVDDTSSLKHAIGGVHLPTVDNILVID